jgi:transcriptional regulator with XRE-family HTH domain
MEAKRAIGIRVREIRKLRGLTQEQLAELLDRSVEAVSLLERGQVSPNFETLERLGERLGISLKDLVDVPGGDNPRQAELIIQLTEIARTLDEDRLRIAIEQIRSLSKLA